MTGDERNPNDVLHLQVPSTNNNNMESCSQRETIPTMDDENSKNHRGGSSSSGRGKHQRGGMMKREQQQRERDNVVRNTDKQQPQRRQQQHQQQQYHLGGGYNHLTTDQVYTFWTDELLPAVLASLPLLGHRIIDDGVGLINLLAQRMMDWAPFRLLQKAEVVMMMPEQQQQQLRDLWQQTVTAVSTTAHNRTQSMAEVLIHHFDANGDGHISPTELINMTEIMLKLRPPQATFVVDNGATTPMSGLRSLLMWFSSEWPLFEWKMGVFLWRTCSGVLFLLTVMSIIPGRCHVYAGRLLRWPILGLTYIAVAVELMVYIVIRLFIRLVEYLVAHPKHSALRRKMASAVSYGEWYAAARDLDASQKRQGWLHYTDDDVRYNWGLIRAMMEELEQARENGDSLQALAVLQQCTRKNVGGIMSEDLFSYANTGEPKILVSQYIDQVERTVRWVTEEALRQVPPPPPPPSDMPDAVAEPSTVATVVTSKCTEQKYERRLERKCDNEKNKLWSMVLATASILDMRDTTKGPIAEEEEDVEDDEDDDDDSISTKDCNEEVVKQPLDVVDDNGKVASAIPSAISTTNSNSDDSSSFVPPLFHREQVLAFLKRARAAYGRTALCLSGGACMGIYHFGHVLGLLENGLLPNIISGTSVGSVVGALVCTRNTAELKRDLEPRLLVTKLICFSRPWKERIKSVLQNGNLFDEKNWHDLIQWFTCGDMTFEEAYRKTGRILCITLTSTTKKAPPFLLNYMSAPNVTIASAVVASAAVPGFVPPQRLHYKDPHTGKISEYAGDCCSCKKHSQQPQQQSSPLSSSSQQQQEAETYFDGSIERDIPVDALAEMLNCQFLVACQANPHIVPFFFNCKGGVGRPSRWSSGTQEESWRGGFVLAALELYLKNHMRAKFRFLNEVEAAVGFTSTMMTQEFVGSTTIVPQVSFWDYFKLFSNPTLKDLYRGYQVGSVAAYEHTAMIKLHYRIADALDECLAKLEDQTATLLYSYSNDKDNDDNEPNNFATKKQQQNNTYSPRRPKLYIPEAKPGYEKHKKKNGGITTPTTKPSVGGNNNSFPTSFSSFSALTYTPGMEEEEDRPEDWIQLQQAPVQ